MGMNEIRIPLVLTGDESPDYAQSEHHTKIELVPNWPDAEVRGIGVVRDKHGNIKGEVGAKILG